MTRYIYHVSVHKQDALCPDVHAVTAFINDTMGCKFVTLTRDTACSRRA